MTALTNQDWHAEYERVLEQFRDWADLGRYRAENETAAPPGENERRVVFLGDSLTDWWSGPESGGFFPGKPYFNRGIAGQTTGQMLIRLRPDVIALRPETVVILAGTNDLAMLHDSAHFAGAAGFSLQPIKDNLMSMTELATAHGIGVVLASLLPTNDYSLDESGAPLVQTIRRQPENIRALNAWMRRYAGENDLTYLDYHSAMVDDQGFLRADLTYDGLHVNAQGYAVMAPLAEAALENARGESVASRRQAER
jgi:lysophospholipase L1-like esterase